jgi:hypothetical protein
MSSADTTPKPWRTSSSTWIAAVALEPGMDADEGDEASAIAMPTAVGRERQIEVVLSSQMWSIGGRCAQCTMWSSMSQW